MLLQPTSPAYFELLSFCSKARMATKLGYSPPIPCSRRANNKLSLIVFSRVVSTILSTLQIEGFDVKALRAFRVLRPLRLVSGVPSKFISSFSNGCHHSGSKLPIKSHFFLVLDIKICVFPAILNHCGGLY